MLYSIMSDIMTNYATLFGFGLFDPSMVKYRGYLERFAAFTKKKKIDVIVLCGGHTNLKFPDKIRIGKRSNVQAGIHLRLSQSYDV